MFIKSKIQFFESKSQQTQPVEISFPSCLSSQRYNFLKANHNTICTLLLFSGLFIKSKIQFFESKSQLIRYFNGWQKGCLSSQRYNFLKANHNSIRNSGISTMLFIKSKIQFFESKSQRKIAILSHEFCCLSSQRYNFLKANHNSYRQTPITYLLFIKSKIQFFESKSQHGDKSIEILNVVYQVKDTIF